MAAENRPLRCPACGAVMNHHADKLVYAAGPGAVDIVEEIHTCSACGAIVSRPAAGDA
jgi:ribosomal protein S27AE